MVSNPSLLNTDLKPSHTSRNGLLFILSLPLIGLWFFYFLLIIKKDIEKQKEICQVFIIHSLILTYFFISELFLCFSLWIVPYFIEPVLWVLIQINVVVVTIGFSLTGVWATWIAGHTQSSFEHYQILVLLYNWFFSSSSSKNK